MTDKLLSPLVWLLLAALIVCTIAGFVMIPADASLPVHWNISGEADSFAPRNLALPLVALPGLLVLAIFAAIPRFVSAERYQAGRHIMQATLPALLALFLAIQAAIVLIGIGVVVDIVRIIALATAVLLIAVGNALPKSRPNSHAGIRLPWTLNDPANWSATHRLGGLLMLISGLALMVLALLIGNSAVLTALLVAAVLAPAVAASIYSYALARNRQH